MRTMSIPPLNSEIVAKDQTFVKRERYFFVPRATMDYTSLDITRREASFMAIDRYRSLTPTKLLASITLVLILSSFIFASNVDKQYYEALSLLRKGDVAQASKAFSFLVETYGSEMNEKQKLSVENRAKIASYAESLSPEQAKALLDKASVVCTQGAQLVAQEKKQDGLKLLNEALTLIEQSSTLATKDKRYNYLLSFVLLYLERNEEAKTYIDKAVKQLPRHLQCYMLKAKVSRRLKDQNEEYKALRYALRIAPENKEANYRLAKLLLSRGSEEQALAPAKKSIGDDKERAQELSAQFKNASLREQIDSIVVEMSIREKRIKTFGKDSKNTISLNKGSGKSRRSSGGGTRGGGGPPPGGGPPD